MTPHQELRTFERNRGRPFTPAQRREILQSLGVIGLNVASPEASNFNGRFASLGWTGLKQLFQTDIALTYSSSAVATAGNTSTTTIAIANAGTTAPCALLVKATNSLAIGAGGQFSIYADGGTTPFMTGVTPAAGVGVALTGVGAGVTLTWTAGTVVINDSWTSAASAWTDQAPSPNNASAAGTARPLIVPGTGGKLALKGNGSTTYFGTTIDLSTGGAPSATNLYVYALARLMATPAGNACIAGQPGGSRIGIYSTNAPLIVQFNGSLVNGSAPTLSTWYLMVAKFVGTTADSMKLGSAAAVTGATAGNGVPLSAGFGYFSSQAAFFSQSELLFAAIATAPAPASLGPAITSWCGVTQV